MFANESNNWSAVKTTFKRRRERVRDLVQNLAHGGYCMDGFKIVNSEFLFDACMCSWRKNMIFGKVINSKFGVNLLDGFLNYGRNVVKSLSLRDFSPRGRVVRYPVPVVVA